MSRSATRAIRGAQCSSRSRPPKEPSASRSIGRPTRSSTPNTWVCAPPASCPLVTIAYLVAQKLHACTDNTDPERPNDRYRDLIDLILVDRLVCDEDRTGVREVCVEIFRLRAKHAWPPCITVLPEWPDGYRSLARQLGFAPPDVHQAAIDVQAIIARIDAARSTIAKTT
jgi:hypothetical protein